MRNVWVGKEYGTAPARVLILGESWYTPGVPLSGYIPNWAAGRVADTLFSRLFNDCSGLRRERATPAQRLAWRDGVAFYNFVPGSIGATTQSRPTASQHRSGIDPLREVLSGVAPAAVWIIGKGQSEHSAPVVQRSGIPHVLVNHPRSGVSSATLRGSWESVCRAARAV